MFKTMHAFYTKQLHESTKAHCSMSSTRTPREPFFLKRWKKEVIEADAARAQESKKWAAVQLLECEPINVLWKKLPFIMDHVRCMARTLAVNMTKRSCNDNVSNREDESEPTGELDEGAETGYSILPKKMVALRYMAKKLAEGVKPNLSKLDVTGEVDVDWLVELDRSDFCVVFDVKEPDSHLRDKMINHKRFMSTYHRQELKRVAVDLNLNPFVMEEKLVSVDCLKIPTILLCKKKLFSNLLKYIPLLNHKFWINQKQVIRSIIFILDRLAYYKYNLQIFKI